jgi:hypothetical protein
MSRTQVGGSTTSLSVGTVTSGSPAAVTLTNGVLSFTIPPGSTGATGATGPQGPAGTSTNSSTVGLPVFVGPNAVTGSPTEYILLNSSNQNGYWGAGSIVSTYNPPVVVGSVSYDLQYQAISIHDFNVTISISITDTGGWTQNNGCSLSTTVTFLANRIAQSSFMYSFANQVTDTRTINFGTLQDWIPWIAIVTTTLTTPNNENFVNVTKILFGSVQQGYYS